MGWPWVVTISQEGNVKALFSKPPPQLPLAFLLYLICALCTGMGVMILCGKPENGILLNLVPGGPITQGAWEGRVKVLGQLVPRPLQKEVKESKTKKEWKVAAIVSLQ